MKAAGHEGSGLARSPEAEARLRKDGYGALRGDLGNIDALARDILSFEAVLSIFGLGKPNGSNRRAASPLTIALCRKIPCPRRCA